VQPRVYHVPLVNTKVSLARAHVEHVWQVDFPLGPATLSVLYVLLVKLLPLLVRPLVLDARWVNTRKLMEKRNVEPVWLASMLLGLATPVVAIAPLVQFLLLLAAEVALRVQSDSIRVLLVKTPVELVWLVDTLPGRVTPHVQVVQLVPFLLVLAVELAHHVQRDRIQMHQDKLHV
jgi:hypothetical protein